MEAQYPSLNIRMPVKEGFSYLAPIAVAIAGYELDVHRDDPAFWLSLVSQKDKEKVEMLQEQLQQGEIHRGPHRIRWKHKEGYIVGTELWLIPVYREGSSLIAIEAIARDITKLEKIEKELLARNKELEVLNQIAYSDETAISINGFLSFSLEILLSVSEASEGGIYLLEENDIRLEICSNGFDDRLGRETIRQAELAAEEDFFSWVCGNPPGNWLVIPIKEFHQCTGYCLLVSPLDRDLTTAENKRLLKTALSGIGDALSRKRAEKRLRFTEERYLGIVESIEDGYYELDTRGRFLFLNQAFSAMLGFPKNELLKKKIEDFCLNWEDFEKAGTTVFESGKGLKGLAVTLKAKKGALFVEISLTPIMDRNGAVQGLRGFVRDITEKKKLKDSLQEAEEKIDYLHTYDYLTGLYNRSFFEKALLEMEKAGCFPVSVITCDVDGLKLINDTLGHNTGNELLKTAGKIIKKPAQNIAVVARIGGDEFAVLLPACSEDKAEEYRKKILEEVENYNRRFVEMPLSLSIGVATTANSLQSSIDVFRNADNNMYRDKLQRSASVRSTLVRALMVTLAERDFITGGHAGRLQEMVTMLGKAAGLQVHELNDLILLSQVHDIGKVGVSDSILFKPGKLTPYEWEKMKKHSEIGFRIAQSSPELSPIAEMILQHHEWWDGSGYPRGLKGDQIHIYSRILAIVDAYDAMTSKRPYREPRSHREALLELRKCKGQQFDPHLVDLFFECLSAAHL